MGGDPWRVIVVAANRDEPIKFRASLEVENLVQVQAPRNDDAGSDTRGVSAVAVARCADGQAGVCQPG